MSILGLNASVSLASLTCCNCGMTFAMPQTIMDERRKDHVNFYCPSGHTQHFPHESDVEKLKKQVERLQKEKEWAQQESKVNAEAANKAERSLTRLRKRAKAGVCPCCKRTVKQMAQHMATKHPDFRP